LRHAYRTPPPAPRSGKDRIGSRGALNALAAGLLLAVGALSGWFGNERFISNAQSTVASYDHTVQLTTAAAAQENLLLHISSNDPSRMEAALSYAEQALANARRHNNKTFRLEVVANDSGIEMLRRDTSPFPQRIEALLSQYDNVSFLACANALRKLRERGVKVELLPGTHSNNTAIDEIIDRLEGGWRYLKV
jgi:intracellular sulfur oxidation DsrE/DsrF family protein